MNISARIASSRPLATTAMHGRVETLRSEGRPVIDFSIAISHFPAPRPVLPVGLPSAAVFVAEDA